MSRDSLGRVPAGGREQWDAGDQALSLTELQSFHRDADDLCHQLAQGVARLS